MTDRELVTVFWATFLAIPAILAIVWGINRGLDQQEREERREILDDLTREANEDLEAYRGEDCPFPDSLTAPRAADSPSAADLSTGQR